MGVAAPQPSTSSVLFFTLLIFLSAYFSKLLGEAKSLVLSAVLVTDLRAALQPLVSVSDPIKVSWLDGWLDRSPFIPSLLSNKRKVITPHAQHERGKVIGRGVHIYIYIYIYMSVVEKKI